MSFLCVIQAYSLRCLPLSLKEREKKKNHLYSVLFLCQQQYLPPTRCWCCCCWVDVVPRRTDLLRRSAMQHRAACYRTLPVFPVNPTLPPSSSSAYRIYNLLGPYTEKCQPSCPLTWKWSSPTLAHPSSNIMVLMGWGDALCVLPSHQWAVYGWLRVNKDWQTAAGGHTLWVYVCVLSRLLFCHPLLVVQSSWGRRVCV